MNIIKKSYIVCFFLILVISACSKKGKSFVIPFQSNSSISPEAKTYITDETITPPILDYSNETSLPVDFGGNLSVSIDAPDLQYVDRFKPIAILFSSMMDKASVESSFTLKDSSNQTIEGSFFWSGSKMYFKPYRPLNPRETYSVTITTSAKDFDGNHLQQDFSQSFTTEAAFLMNHTLKAGTNDYDVATYASNGVIIDKNAYSGNLIVESSLSGADYVIRVRLFKLGIGEENAYTICDSSLPCNNSTPDMGLFTTDLSSLNSSLQPKEGTNIYYYYIETTSGRTYVSTFAFQYGRTSNDPNELQSNGGWLALENNTSFGMYQIKRLFERFIKSDGSHTADNFTINGKKFSDFLNEAKSYPPTYGPINGGGCQLDDPAWLNSTNRINYLTNFGPYCNLSFEVCAIFCGTGYSDNYVGYINIPPLAGSSTNVNINMLPDSTKLRIELLGKKLQGMLRSYIRDGSFPASLSNGYVIEDRFFMNQSTQKLAYANTTLTVDANGDLKISILGGPSWAINDPNFNVKPWSDSIDSTSDWEIIKGSWLDWLLSIFIPGVINQLTPKIVQGTIKDTIQKVSANIMNAVLSKTRVDGTNDGINICLPAYLPDPLKTICLTTGAKMKPTSTHIGWTHSGYNGIRSYLEANMTVINNNATWPRPPVLTGPGNKGFIKFLPTSFIPDSNLVSLYAAKNYRGALVILNPDVVNQAAYGLWKEGAFNFVITKPVLEQINNV
ncbi:MAG: Ig-like domain-containing protein, partial [Leptonema sp. (in: bacteria)]